MMGTAVGQSNEQRGEGIALDVGKPETDTDGMTPINYQGSRCDVRGGNTEEELWRKDSTDCTIA